jgi:hypothetical protein
VCPSPAHHLQLSDCKLEETGFLENFGPRVSRVSAIMVGNVPVEDRLDGASNFNSWKSRLLITLEESDLMKFVEEIVPEPTNALEKT